jgi:hypothetical protein
LKQTKNRKRLCALFQITAVLQTTKDRKNERTTDKLGIARPSANIIIPLSSSTVTTSISNHNPLSPLSTPAHHHQKELRPHIQASGFVTGTLYSTFK